MKKLFLILPIAAILGSCSPIIYTNQPTTYAEQGQPVTDQVFYDELTWLCLNQYGAFNSPVWFNVGLYHEYGVGKNSGKGNWFYNRQTGEAERAITQYEYPQGSACFIQIAGRIAGA